MRSLEQHIKDMMEVWDCQVHIFGRDGIGTYPITVGKHSHFISMVDNPLKYKDEDLLPYFKEYFKDNGKHVLPGYVAAVGKDLDETKKILETWPDNFAFIGEVLCYKHYKDSKDVEHEHFDASIVAGIGDYGLPIFIHWDLNGKHDKELESLLDTFKNTQFILCHCGINELDDPYKAFLKANYLQGKHTNLWLDISWKALEFICADKNRIPMMEIPDHVLVGTDFNNSMEYFGIDFEETYDNFRKVVNKFNVDNAIKTLLQHNKNED